MIMLLLLVLLLLLAGAWFAITHVPGLFSNQQATPTGTYPDVAGTYNGIIDNTTAGITTSMSLSIQQNHGQISGQFTVGPALVGSGPFTGSVSTANHIQFTVQGYHGNAPLFFSGTVQSNGSLSGDYCSLGQNGQCSQQAGASGTWQVSRGQAIQPAVAATSTVPQAPTATPTPKHRKHKH